jgi:hypothetical protein
MCEQMGIADDMDSEEPPEGQITKPNLFIDLDR